MTDVCPECGGEYVKVGGHWAHTDCEPPTPSDYQTDIITGLMFGDGWVNHHNDAGSPFFAVGNTNRGFLEWFDDVMGILTTGVNEATGSANSKKDYYKVRTRRMSFFSRFADWYATGGIEFPDVDLNGTMLKMWFVSDGYLRVRDDRPTRLVLCNRTQDNRRRYFSRLFQPLGVVPQVYADTIEFRADDSEGLIGEMGEMPPGFSYKLAELGGGA